MLHTWLVLLCTRTTRRLCILTRRSQLYRTTAAVDLRTYLEQTLLALGLTVASSIGSSILTRTSFDHGSFVTTRCKMYSCRTSSMTLWVGIRRGWETAILSCSRMQASSWIRTSHWSSKMSTVSMPHACKEINWAFPKNRTLVFAQRLLHMFSRWKRNCSTVRRIRMHQWVVTSQLTRINSVPAAW